MKFREFLKEVSNISDGIGVNESSLTRVWKHNTLHDCGALTAFRKYQNCGYDSKGESCDSDEPVELSKKEKNKRNLALSADLKRLGYGVTKIIGKYPEGGSSVKEVSFFVVDVNDKGLLENDLKVLGYKYDQDSVLFIPRGSVDGDSKAYLIGTNRCCNNELGYGKTLLFNKGKLGYDSPIYTTFVNGRPFIFESCTLTDELFGSGTTSIMADRYSKEISG